MFDCDDHIYFPTLVSNREHDHLVQSRCWAERRMIQGVLNTSRNEYVKEAESMIYETVAEIQGELDEMAGNGLGVACQWRKDRLDRKLQGLVGNANQVLREAISGECISIPQPQEDILVGWLSVTCVSAIAFLAWFVLKEK